MWNSVWDNNYCLCNYNIVFTDREASHLSKKTVFQFDLETGMTATEIGPGDSFDVKPVVKSDATEEMYVFIQVDMPETSEGVLYSFEVDRDWIPIGDHDGKMIYAYAGSEMTVLQPGDSTSPLTERMTMNEISNAEYAAIDDINIVITGYALGTEDVSTDPQETWDQCKQIGNIE